MFKVNGHGPGSKFTLANWVNLNGQNGISIVSGTPGLGTVALPEDSFKISKGKVAGGLTSTSSGIFFQPINFNPKFHAL